jgi:cytochrome d ubiquinol oxidase subunit I
MSMFFNHIFLSRLQFAFTTMFHINWPLLSIGLSLFLVVTEALWLKTKDPAYYHQTRFWSKLFLLNFAVGVASGIPLEFQFGTNWSLFSVSTHGFFGNILGFEGAMAFMLEAGFLGIMLFGWQRVSPRFHLFSTCMVALGASLSAFWIMVANSWMQTPAGGRWVSGRNIIEAAASPPITLKMMLYVMITLLPIMFLYNVYQYMVFRGKTGEAGYGEE